VLGLLMVMSFCVFNFSVYVPLMARTVLGLGPDGFGFLMAALGVGAVGGALTVGATQQPRLGPMFVAASVALLGLLSLSVVRQPGIAAGLLAVTGFAGIATVASCNTRVQLAAPPELRGRLISLYIFVSGGAFPIGAFLAGAISEHWGVSTALAAAGITGLVALGMIGFWWRTRHRD